AAVLVHHSRSPYAPHRDRLVSGAAREGGAGGARRAPGLPDREHPDEHEPAPEPREPAARSGQAQGLKATTGPQSDRRALPDPERGRGDPPVGRGSQPPVLDQGVGYDAEAAAG